ncbi:hypothetical protein QE152_g6438 [Popillia japonica]|uniref:Uncharacterized protein n=1 Tax=Popillia japonica TaxID=7064 RepID=A0AAW1MII4_POPJA
MVTIRDSDKMKTCSMPKLVFPNSNCMFEVPAEGSWERSERRHFPDINNRSTLDLSESPFQIWERSERRHFPDINNRSTLDLIVEATGGTFGLDAQTSVQIEVLGDDVEHHNMQEIIDIKQFGKKAKSFNRSSRR